MISTIALLIWVVFICITGPILLMLFWLFGISLDAVVGTAAFPLFICSAVLLVAAAVLAIRVLWLRFHDRMPVRRQLIITAVAFALAVLAFCTALYIAGSTFLDLWHQMHAGTYDPTVGLGA